MSISIFRKSLRHSPFNCLWAVGLLLSSLSSCGSEEAGPELYSVSGEVKFADELIPDGRIEFRKVDGDKRAYSAEIKEGKYELESEAGKMTVKIYASRIIPGKFDTSNRDEDPQPVGEMYIPQKYNSKSDLTAEIKPESNTIPFDLKK